VKSLECPISANGNEAEIPGLVGKLSLWTKNQKHVKQKALQAAAQMPMRKSA
jgi:hypothetical protein